MLQGRIKQTLKHKEGKALESETEGTEAIQRGKTGRKTKKEKELERENGYLRSSRM